MSRTAFYTGSFDPLTNGHVDIIRHAGALCDRLVVAIGVHPGKTPLFDADDRARLIRDACAPLLAEQACALDVVTFHGLAVTAAKAAGATLIVRGLRNGSDLDYEMEMAGTNAVLAPDLRTVFLAASPSVGFITATLVRQIAALGGDVSAFVPPCVHAALDRIHGRTSLIKELQ